MSDSDSVSTVVDSVYKIVSTDYFEFFMISTRNSFHIFSFHSRTSFRLR